MDTNDDIQKVANLSQNDKITVNDTPISSQERLLDTAFSFPDAGMAATSSQPLRKVEAGDTAEVMADSSSKIDLSKYVPTQEIPQRKIEQLDVSTPPPGTYYFPVVQQGYSYAKPKYRERFSRPDILPPRSAPLRDQLEACARRWAVWATEVENPERRGELIKWVSNCMENIWRQGLKDGLTAETSDDQKHRTHSPNQRQNKKRLGNPSRTVVLRSQSWKNAERYAITAGELEEAGITKETFEGLLANHDLKQGEVLLSETLESIGRDEIVIADWLNTAPRTTYNTWGRDLVLYCLFEVQWSHKELQKLHRLLAGFTQANQQKNTLRRIEEEQERQDLFLALALELNRSRSCERDSPDAVSVTSSSPEPMEAHKQQESNIDYSENDMKDGDMHASAKESLQKTSQDYESGDAQDTMQLDQANTGSHSMATPAKRPAAAENNTEFDENTTATKKQKFDDRTIDITNDSTPLVVLEEQATDDRNQQPVVQSDNSMQQPSPSSARSSTFKERKQAYLSYVIGPIVNRLLENAGHPHINNLSADWQAMRLALVDANIQIETRNGLARELNKFSLAATMQPKGSDPNDVPTAEDFLRQQLIHAIPVRGFTPQELHVVLAQFCNPEMENWKTVLLSVAYFDMETQTWYRRSDINTASEVPSAMFPAKAEDSSKKPSLKIVLRYKTSHNPQDFSSRKVTAHKGFRFRYTSQSTLAQRKSMDEILETYIEQRKRASKINWAMQGPRFGRYEVLPHPDDPLRTIVIHGFWDEKDGSLAEDSEWFFKGLEDPDPVNHGKRLAARQQELMDHLLRRDSEMPYPQITSDVEFDTAIAQPCTSNSALINPYLYQEPQSEKKAVRNKSLKLRLTKPVNPFDGIQSASAKCTAKGKGPATDSSISTSRPKRGTATKSRMKSYHEEYGSGDSDDEYRPY